jgi:predicted RND superfamily exporter protein
MPGLFVSAPRSTSSKHFIDLRRPLNDYAKWLEAKRPNPLFAGVLLVIGVLGILRVSFDEDFVRYFSEQTSFRSDTEQISTLLSGPYHIDVVYDAGDSGAVFSERSIRDLSSIASHFAGDERVVNVFSIVDVLESIAPLFSSDSNVGSASEDQLAQYFLTYELSLNRGQSTLDFIDTDHRLARVSVLLRDVSMGEIRALVEESELGLVESYLMLGW